MSNQSSRQVEATVIRNKATQQANDRTSPNADELHSATLVDGTYHRNNEEETKYSATGSYMSFSKGLKHDPETGFPVEHVVQSLREAIDSGHVAEFDKLQIGDADPNGNLHWRFYDSVLANTDKDKQYRRWEAPTAGFVYDLQGPDSLAVTMPPAPAVEGDTSDELTAEMAEVYLLACLRDVPFAAFSTATVEGISADHTAGVDQAVSMLKDLPFYQAQNGEQTPGDRVRPDTLTRQNVFRGQTHGEHIGPYLSQFLLVGNEHLGSPKTHQTKDGMIQYGSIRIDQRVRVATPYVDYMTHWDEWLDVQHGANVRDTQEYIADGNKDYPAYRFITTPRDLATYVHFDALYEAYLNACIWLLNTGASVDPNFKTNLARTSSTEGFALFGGPHVLTLVTEVATRALKAVRFQKFNNHLRARPEVLAARVAAYDAGMAGSNSELSNFAPMHEALAKIGLIDLVKAHNAGQNERDKNKQYLHEMKNGHGKTEPVSARDNLALLPMAFPEGSPMHPAYGAGHATVAGACVTMLKAFFDEEMELPFAYVPSADGCKLIPVTPEKPLTVGNELNKLAANISIGRNMAGVHYYSDYIDSMRMGEAIAIGVLQEQALTYQKDAFTVQFKTFDGKKCTIAKPEHSIDKNEPEKSDLRVTVKFA